MNIMSQMYGDPQINPPAASNSSMVAVHADRQGNLIVVDSKTGHAVAGKVFSANMGTLSAPVRCDGSAGITARRPQAFIRVPLGTTIIPLRIKVHIEASGAATFEFSAAQCSNDVGNGTSAAADVGPVNLNTRLGTDSGLCTARQLASANVDVEVNFIEYDHKTFASGVDNQEFEVDLSKLGVPPVLYGPASLLVYGGGTTVDIFAKFVWIELDSGLLIP